MGDAILCVATFSASVLSGMLGVGVGFAAVPILGMAGLGLVNGVQPIALFLNGVTALSSAVSFGQAGYVDWPQSRRLALVASIFSPFGAYAAKWVHEPALWGAYFLAVIGAIYLLLIRRSWKRRGIPFGIVLLICAPVSAVGGMLGVGPGILLVPAMMGFGFNPRSAAAMTSVAVTVSSFASLVPLLGHAAINVKVALPLVLASCAGAYLGGYLSSNRVSETALRKFFVVLIVALSAYTGIPLAEETMQRTAGYANGADQALFVRIRPRDVGYQRDRTALSRAWLSR